MVKNEVVLFTLNVSESYDSKYPDFYKQYMHQSKLESLLEYCMYRTKRVGKISAPSTPSRTV